MYTSTRNLLFWYKVYSIWSKNHKTLLCQQSQHAVCN